MRHLYDTRISDRYRIPTYRKMIWDFRKRMDGGNFSSKTNKKIESEINELVLLERREEEEKAIAKGI